MALKPIEGSPAYFEVRDKLGAAREKQLANCRKELVRLTESVTGFLARLDDLMQQPSTETRGQQVARLCNAMEMENDRIRYGVLGIDFRTDKKPARAAARRAHTQRGRQSTAPPGSAPDAAGS